MQLLVFEDEVVADLAPISTARPAYAITCASYRLIDWLRGLGKPIVGWVRPHLRPLQSLDFGVADASEWDPDDEALLVVNSRVVPSPAVAKVLRALAASSTAGAIHCDGQLAAAFLPRLASQPADPLISLIDRVLQAAGELPEVQAALPMFRWPHDVIAENIRLMNESL